MADELSAGMFVPHVTSIFRVVGDSDPPADLELVEVQASGAQPGARRSEPFALVFAGSGDHALGQRIHRLSHPVLGELDLFLVPIGHSGDGRLHYEAVFN